MHIYTRGEEEEDLGVSLEAERREPLDPGRREIPSAHTYKYISIYLYVYIYRYIYVYI